MEYQRLGKTGLAVSRLAFGPPRPDGRRAGADCTQELANEAFAAGVNLFFDPGGITAGEVALRRFLGQLPRDEFHVAAKIAVHEGEFRYDLISADELGRRIDEARARLGFDELDLVLVEHWPAEGTYERFRDELFPHLQEARSSGKLRYIGGSEVVRYDGSHSWIVDGLRDDLFDAVLVSYNMINQSAEREVLPLCRRNHTGVIAAQSVGRVFGNPRRLALTLEALRDATVIDPGSCRGANTFDWLLSEDVPTVVAAARKFAAGGAGVSTVLSAATSPAQLEENLSAVTGPPLPAADRLRLREMFGGLCCPIGA